MKWAVVSPFFDQEDIDRSRWLNQYFSSDEYKFQLVGPHQPLPKWHDKTVKITTLPEWKIYWEQATAALNTDADGLITVFPQLPAAIGLQKLLRRSKKPVIAWIFNIGTCSVGPRRWLARLSLSQIDRFIVHTSREIDIYSEWLNIPKDRFEFIPFPSPDIDVMAAEDTKNPFVVSLGSAHRDFSTLFQAVETLNLPTVVASGPSALEGLDIPSQVQTPFGIARAECLKLAQQGRINVVPLQPKENVTSAGQVTMVEAMIMGRAIIATDCYGTSDYVTHGETGWLVRPGSVEDMTEAIDRLWRDHTLRTRLARNAQAYARANFSDAGAAQVLEKVIDDVTGKKSANTVPTSSVCAVPTTAMGPNPG
ncbi:MAG: glycosyltransferase family 4 protein [Leptolyngbyaceae cyanobacterium]